jgi:hypothetical protein
MSRTVAVRETDQAQLARADDALERLHAIRVRLCYVNPDDAMLEELSEALCELTAAIGIARLWIPKRKEQ